MPFRFETANERWRWYKQGAGTGNPIQNLESQAQYIDSFEKRYKSRPLLQNKFREFNSFQNIFEPEAEMVFNEIIEMVEDVARNPGSFSRTDRDLFNYAAGRAKDYYSVQKAKMQKQQQQDWYNQDTSNDMPAFERPEDVRNVI